MSEGEKSFDPTPRRLEEARRRGDVARSDEVTGAAVYLGFLAGSAAAGTAGALAAGSALSVFLGAADHLEGAVLGAGGLALTAELLGAALAPLAPLLLLPPVAALVALLAQRGLAFSTEKLAPKAERLSPLAALRNRFGPTGLVDFARRLAKLCAVAAVVGALLVSEIDAVVGALAAPPAATTALMMHLVRRLLVAIVLISVAIAAIDLAWVRFDHRRRLKMSLQELRDEMKESEGDPALRARRRRRATEIATNRMLADVPGADVVVVNPTHYAVALHWDRSPGSAPRCVAKGRDALAARIREIAEESGVPVHRDAPTARTLHDTVEIGQQIPPELYRAVAASIRFAEDMRRRMRERMGPAP